MGLTVESFYVLLTLSIFLTVINNTRRFVIVVGCAPIKAADERCKISFNIKSNGLHKNKTERPTLSVGESSSKLVPYDDGFSDDSECENDFSYASCNNVVNGHPNVSIADEKLNGNCVTNAGHNVVSVELPAEDALLCETLPPDSLVNGTSADTRPASLADGSDTLNQSETVTGNDSVHEMDEQNLPGANEMKVMPDYGNDDKKLQVVLHNVMSHEAYDCRSIDSAKKHISSNDSMVSSSKRKRHGRHHKVKAVKRHRRRSTSTSTDESSDESEMEYIWVEKSAVLNGNSLANGCNQPPNNIAIQPVNGRLILYCW
jgi:hypothetical protein